MSACIYMLLPNNFLITQQIFKKKFHAIDGHPLLYCIFLHHQQYQNADCANFWDDSNTTIISCTVISNK